MNSTARTLTGRFDRWIQIAAIASVVLLISAASLRRVWQTDFWWQYATGRYVTAHGPPRVDPFSYGEPGREWVEPRWLYCLGLAALCDRFGVEAAVVGAALAAIGALALVAVAVPSRRNAAVAAAVLALAALTARPRFTVRPEIVTYLCLALAYWIIERYRAKGGRILLVLPLLQIVWVNAHTLFVLGPAIVGLFFVSSVVEWLAAGRGAPGTGGAPDARGTPDARAGRLRTARAGGLALLATSLACLASPYGPRVFDFTLRLFTEVHGTAFKEFIQELESPFTYHGLFVSVAAYKTLIALGVLSIAANARRLDLFRALVWGAMLYVSALAVRNIALFAIAAVPFTIDNLGRSDWWERGGRVALARRLAKPLARALGVAVVASCVITAWAFATDRYHVRQFETNQFGVGIAAHRYPIAAVDFMREHGIDGPVFSTMHESSYLLFRDHQVFFDPRIEIYTEAHFRRYVELIAGGGDWDAAVEEFGIRAALVDNTFLGFVRRLGAAPDWDLVYFDECVALFVRAGSPGAPGSSGSPPPPPIRSVENFGATIARVRERLRAPVAYESAPLFARVASPTPYHRVANFLITLGRVDEAEPFLRDAVAAYPGASGARVSLAQLLESRGDAAGAGREYETAYRWAPDDPDVLVALGRFRAVSGRLAEAAPLLERALARAPENALAWALSGEIAAATGRFDDAERRLLRAASLDPSNALVAERLVEVRRHATAGAGGSANRDTALARPSDPR